MNPAVKTTKNNPWGALACVLALGAIASAPLTGCRGDRTDKPPRQFFPDMDEPFLNVELPYPGSSPDEVERQIIRPAEPGDGIVPAKAGDGLGNIGAEKDVVALARRQRHVREHLRGPDIAAIETDLADRHGRVSGGVFNRQRGRIGRCRDRSRFGRRGHCPF